MSELVLSNRQRVRRVDLAALRRLIRWLLEVELRVPSYKLAVYLTAAPEMSALNEKYLHHAGSTDVITFDYAGDGSGLQGEIFICLDVAAGQARRFRTTWQAETVRYAIHGVLHLLGFDDVRAAGRRKMKREEGRLLRRTARRFPLSKVAARPRLVR